MTAPASADAPSGSAAPPARPSSGGGRALVQRLIKVNVLLLLALPLLLLFFPRFVDDTVLLQVLGTANVFVMFGASWDVLSGYTGQVNFGHAAFIGVGAYAVALLSKYRPEVSGEVALLVAVTGGQVLSHWAKGLFDRPRPDLVSHEAYVYTASFPSGHSMMAAATYLTLAVMLARAAPSRALKAYVVAVALLLALAVGVSRVYLGVHWPSDVLAGWLAGAAWALACYLVADWLGRRGGIEPERDAGSGRDP